MDIGSFFWTIKLTTPIRKASKTIFVNVAESLASESLAPEEIEN